MIYTTYPSVVEAEEAGRALVERRLCACVNILPGMISNYWWNGAVERGEEVRITRHGRPVARLVPDREIDKRAIDKAIAELRAIREGARFDGLSWKELRDAGRR